MKSQNPSVFFWSVPYGLPPCKPPTPPDHWTTKREKLKLERQLESEGRMAPEIL